MILGYFPLGDSLFFMFWRGIEVGHNEAVLKTVGCNRHVGSNPTRVV